MEILENKTYDNYYLVLSPEDDVQYMVNNFSNSLTGTLCITESEGLFYADFQSDTTDFCKHFEALSCEIEHGTILLSNQDGCWLFCETCCGE